MLASSRACRSHRVTASLEGSAIPVGAGEPAKGPALEKHKRKRHLERWRFCFNQPTVSSRLCRTAAPHAAAGTRNSRPCAVQGR
ncbi:hypothetical protein FYM84_09605 [Pseudomonas sp. CAH-1]|nr:hypothetical protein [Pseudomonas sp. CAH-1]